MGNKKINVKPKKFGSNLLLRNNIKIKKYKKIHSPIKKATKKPNQKQNKSPANIYIHKKRCNPTNKNSNSSDYNSINQFIKKDVSKNFKSTKKMKVSHVDINYVNMNDQEKNSLDYRRAKEYDKRTYFQFYWSLLKKKHLIFFTFVPANDYNLSSIKISLFLHTFSLSFTICGFFMNDETMHKIYEDY